MRGKPNRPLFYGIVVGFVGNDIQYVIAEPYRDGGGNGPVRMNTSDSPDAVDSEKYNIRLFDGPPPFIDFGKIENGISADGKIHGEMNAVAFVDVGIDAKAAIRTLNKSLFDDGRVSFIDNNAIISKADWERIRAGFQEQGLEMQYVDKQWRFVDTTQPVESKAKSGLSDADRLKLMDKSRDKARARQPDDYSYTSSLSEMLAAAQSRGAFVDRSLSAISQPSGVKKDDDKQIGS